VHGLLDSAARYSKVSQLVIVETLKNPDGFPAFAKAGEAPPAVGDQAKEGHRGIPVCCRHKDRQCDHHSISVIE
jgi:hypothetical protein